MVKLRTLCQNYLQENFWLAEATKDTTGRSFRHLCECLGNIDITRLTFERLTAYKGWLLKTGRSKTTANIYLRSLSPVFQWAINLHLIDKNPLTGVGQFKVARRPIRIYEDWQVERLLRFAPNLRWKAIILAARTTGFRRGELLNLTKDNLRNGYIYCESKRDSKRTWGWEPKDKENRKVPLVDELAEMLNGLECYYPLLSEKRYENILRLKAAGLMTGWIIRCPDQNFRRDFVAIQRKAFGRQVGDFHSLRKTYTTRMCESLPEHFVMRLTGHNSLKTMTYYLASRESYYETARKTASGAIKIGPTLSATPQKDGVYRRA
ncbi:MAG: tyrosine-type recombinase/integrase [Planctomycetota bacterium]|jgi:integrase